VQTNWKYPKNAAVQSQPREFTEEEKLAVEESDELAEFIRNVAQRFVSSQRCHAVLSSPHCAINCCLRAAYLTE